MSASRLRIRLLYVVAALFALLGLACLLPGGIPFWGSDPLASKVRAVISVALAIYTFVLARRKSKQLAARQ